MQARQRGRRWRRAQKTWCALRDLALVPPHAADQKLRHLAHDARDAPRAGVDGVGGASVVDEHAAVELAEHGDGPAAEHVEALVALEVIAPEPDPLELRIPGRGCEQRSARHRRRRGGTLNRLDLPGPGVDDAQAGRVRDDPVTARPAVLARDGDEAVSEPDGAAHRTEERPLGLRPRLEPVPEAADERDRPRRLVVGDGERAEVDLGHGLAGPDDEGAVAARVDRQAGDTVLARPAIDLGIAEAGGD